MMGSIKKCHSHNWIIYEYYPKKCENGIEYENEMKTLAIKREPLIKKQEENQEIVLKLVLEFENQGKKINFSEIAKLCNLDRRTVKKYYQYK